ncbi:MAG: trypsin-like peptidase domain-containing protein [Mogibacterium sp.]|nr:trypsin-like peptidase domain-containing protein [Mogibacterium sp.]
MDEQDKNLVSFDSPVEEPEPVVKTVEIDYPQTTVEVEPAHAAPVGPTHTKKKEKKYVTKGALIVCMILTMIISSLLGAFLAGTYVSKLSADGRTAREDSELSQLNLSDATGSDMTVSQIVDKNENAVVEIVVSGTQQNMWGQMQLVQGAGSGVIVREDGYIATNYHVIQGANKVQVTLHNGESYPAQIVGSDAANDIAVVKIEAKGLTTATIGDSSTVDVGDLAVAIGNPLGQLGGTATTGIISALDRTLDVEGTTLTLMQTDAAINGGNSGGGLFNSKGELIGIVESKASAVGVEGLAFALPINTVSPIINDLIENGGNAQTANATPAVGVVISDVSEENAQYYGLESAGVYIAQVTGENAMKAGFQPEDRIVSFNGKEIKDSNSFITLVRKCKVGDTVTIVVSRKGQQIEIKTVLEELQQQQP